MTVRERVSQLPDTPAIAERFPGYDAAGWTGLVAPTGTPAEILRKVNADVVAILRQPSTIARFADLGMISDPGTPAEYERFLAAELQKWKDVARIANVRLDG